MKVGMALNPEMVGETLTRHYRLACELFNTYPLPHFTHQLSQGSVELHLDRLDLDHLEALCHTLKNKVSPLSLRVVMPADIKVSPMMAKVVERAVEGVGVCVVASLTLTLVTLDGVKLRGRTLKLLCEGVRKARTLKTLVLRNCGLGDSGTESVCQAVKNVPSITHLSLVNCGVPERGATAIACLIKHQRLNRDSAMWQDTLRQRQPHLDGMKGLRRLTLNSNPALGDQGIAVIVEALTEDLWIKAVDLQHCGVGQDGGASFRALLHTNHTLEVVDLRNNPFLPDAVVEEVTSLLQGRCSEATSQYSWLKTSSAEEDVVEHRKGGTAGYRASGRIMKARRGKLFSYTAGSRRPNPPSQLGVPWRVEHRLYERKEGLAPGAMVKQCMGERESVGEASQPPKESVPEEDVNEKKMRKKLQLYKKKYRKEREQRKKLERKLSRIQTQLRGLHTLDENTVSHIEECFLKFHLFLSLMHNSGEELPSSSPDSVSPSHHPPIERGSNQTHPGSIGIIHQPSNASNSHSHPIPVSHPTNSKQGRDLVAEQAMNESELSMRNKNNPMTQNILRPERYELSQGQTSHGSESEAKVSSETIPSNQHRKPSRSTQDQLENEENRGERMIQEMNTKFKSKKQKKENMNSKENNSVTSYSSSKPVKEKQKHTTQVNDGTQGWDLGKLKKTAMEQQLINPSNADSVAMRVEFGKDRSRGIRDEWNNGEFDEYTNGIDGKTSQCGREDEQVEKVILSKELSFKTSKIKDVYTLQEGNLNEGEQSPSKSGASQSPLTSQSPHVSKSSISHLLKESPLSQQSSVTRLPQEGSLNLNYLPQENRSYQQTPAYQESQSSGSQSPSSESLPSQSLPNQSSPNQSPKSQSPANQSPPRQSPQENHSPERIQSPKKANPTQRRPLYQSSKSPRKSRSCQKEPPGVQGSEVSETDDEKMRNLSAWLQGRTRGRASTPSSSSSISISEHLQQSHSSWTKRKGHRKAEQVEAPREKEKEEEEEVEEVPGESEIDLSDFEDLSLSGITLTNTSVAEDIHTPGEEDF